MAKSSLEGADFISDPYNNHVERTDRMFRFLEKVRYKWRRPSDAGAIRGTDAG